MGLPIDNGGICNTYSHYNDLPLTDCGNAQKFLRKWTVLDVCSQQVIFGTQIIKMSDVEAPDLECPGQMVFEVDGGSCETNVFLDNPIAEDACGSGFSLIPVVPEEIGTLVEFNDQYIWYEVPFGEHTILWEAEDDCGNSSSCTQQIQIIDKTPPVAACDEHTIISISENTATGNGITLIAAEVFDDGSYDECSEITLEVRRMDSCIDFDWTTNGACVDDQPDGSLSGPDRGVIRRDCVPFACCDVSAGPIMVELKITDESDNENFCMVEVEVQDKLPPSIECPSNEVVDCEFWFETEDTGNTFIDPQQDPLTPIFGSAAANDECDYELLVRIRIKDNCAGESLGSGLPAGMQVPDDAVRRIQRTFKASDGSGNNSDCNQYIWVVDNDRFDINDITWPGDRTFASCTDEIPIDYPVVNDDNCSLVGVTFEDERFDFVDSACFKILREWSVIDWCQFDGLGAGYWGHIQVIKVNDNTGVDFTDCPSEPVTYCVEDSNVELPQNNQAFTGATDPLSSACSAHITMQHTITELCSDIVYYDVKVYPNNGAEYVTIVESQTPVAIDSNHSAILTMDTRSAVESKIRDDGLPYNESICESNGEKDYHRILWSVEDGCGNITTCEYLFRLEDCKKPTPVCIDGLSSVVMPSAGEVTIWAADFNVSSFDDCTDASDLVYSYTGLFHAPSAKFACDCTSVVPDYPGQPCFGYAQLGDSVFPMVRSNGQNKIRTIALHTLS
jgi:hypothetical protein